MMKRMLMLVLPLVAALMFGCQNTPFSLDEGRYIPEQSEKDDMAVPILLLGKIIVLRSFRIYSYRINRPAQ